MKCPIARGESFRLKLLPGKEESHNAEVLDAAVLRRAAGLKASIALDEAACARLGDECDRLYQKLTVQRERIQARRASLEKLHTANKLAEADISELLSKCRDEVRHIDKMRQKWVAETLVVLQFSCLDASLTGIRGQGTHADRRKERTAEDVGEEDASDERPPKRLCGDNQEVAASGEAETVKCEVCSRTTTNAAVIRLFLSGQEPDSAAGFWKAVKDAPELQSSMLSAKRGADRKARLEEFVRFLKQEHEDNGKDIGALTDELDVARECLEKTRRRRSKLETKLKALRDQRTELEQGMKTENHTAVPVQPGAGPADTEESGSRDTDA
ncbi:hypothetical protein BV20DRAFT_1058086 [Pilatotrama ljubarskyi]|nr:hypothetical protein BV20DRAFT_1058086 [Pilatotrama ljubarskyi]